MYDLERGGDRLSDRWNGMLGFYFLSVVSVRISPRSLSAPKCLGLPPMGKLARAPSGSSLPFMRIDSHLLQSNSTARRENRGRPMPLFSFRKGSLHRLYSFSCFCSRVQLGTTNKNGCANGSLHAPRAPQAPTSVVATQPPLKSESHALRRSWAIPVQST
jgi:hypothetical protein